MTRRNLTLLALGATALLAVVAVVANGKPLGGHSDAGGSGALPSSFGDFVFTSAVLVAGVLVLAIVAVFLGRRVRLWKIREEYQEGLITPIVGFFAVVVLFVVAERLFLAHHQTPYPPRPAANHGKLQKHAKIVAASAHFVWSEAAIVTALLLVAAGWFVVLRMRQRGRLPAFPVGPVTLTRALDESLDDLRTAPDLREAIVAAYARMETALAVSGVPRRPSEAPREYLERALLELDTSGDAVRRLTDLFEFVRFSPHEPEPGMRDDAIRALTAVRDDVRPAARVAA